MSADVPSVFGKIYRDNEWTNGSGPGSFRSFNRELLDYLTTGVAGRFYGFNGWDGRGGTRVPGL